MVTEPKWLTHEQVIAIHSRQLRRFGGAPGLRDEGLLHSAIERPLNKWQYEQAERPELAAAYAFGLAKNHAFVDGNKRIAFMSMMVLNGVKFAPDPAQATDDHNVPRRRRGQRGKSRPLDSQQLAEGLMAKREKPDSEKNRFSARAARYARVGANVGGVAARYAGPADLGGEPQPRRRGVGARVGARQSQGPADEGRPVDGDHSRSAAAGIRRRIAEAAERSAADGLGLRQAAHERGTRSRLAEEIRRASSIIRPRRLRSARCIAPARSTARNWPANCNIPTCSRRSRPTCSSCNGCSRSAGASIPRSIPARSARRSARACARNSTTGARPSTSRSTAPCSTAVDIVRVPRAWPELSTGRLLTLDWLDGTRMLAHRNDPLAVRNTLATAMFTAWWFPFSRFGVIHGDPHLGNYTVFDAREPVHARTSRSLPASISSITAACASSRRNSCAASSISITASCTTTTNSSCAPTRPGASAGCRATSSTRSTSGRASSMRRCSTTACARIADGVAPAEYGRREAFRVHQALKQKGPVTVPREFVFMDRAAIGLGAVFLHLRAELNFYRLFNEAIENFSMERVAERQAGGARGGRLVAGHDMANIWARKSIAALHGGGRRTRGPGADDA